MTEEGDKEKSNEIYAVTPEGWFQQSAEELCDMPNNHQKGWSLWHSEHTVYMLQKLSSLT